MTLDEALAGKEIPEKIKNSLTLINVPYFSFDGEIREGQLVVHKEVAEEIQQIFKKLLDAQFPIQQIIPIVAYRWNDDASMAANNTSAFNYRFVHGENRLSNHSYGNAIDINPIQNPYHRGDGMIMPPGAKYNPTQSGTITPEVVSIFKSYGWKWGGEWPRKDYQHFQKLNEEY